MSLRAELIGAVDPYPEFAVLLPEGWEATDAAFTGVDARVAEAIDRLPVAVRAGARARLEELLGSARAEATKGSVIRSFAPSAAVAETPLPVSLVASWLTAPGAATAAELGADAMTRFGAAPFDPAGTILRWRLDQRAAVEDGTADVSGHGYLLRVPGQPKTALVFRSTILRGVGADVIPDEGVDAMSAICDAIVASVRWRRGD